MAMMVSHEPGTSYSHQRRVGMWGSSIGIRPLCAHPAASCWGAVRQAARGNGPQQCWRRTLVSSRQNSILSILVHTNFPHALEKT